MMPHEPTDKCLPVHCFSHNVDEWNETSASIVCGECGHVFADGDDLARVTTELWGADWAVVDIYACPFCTHDL